MERMISKGLEQAIWMGLSDKQRQVAKDYKNKHGKPINLEELYKIKD